MTDTVFEQREKIDLERRAEIESLREQSRRMCEVVQQEIEHQYTENFSPEEHKTLQFELSKLKLSEACFTVVIKQMDACDDIVKIFNKRLARIEEKHTGKYWYSKAKWLSEFIRVCATIVGTAIVLQGFLIVKGG